MSREEIVGIPSIGELLKRFRRARKCSLIDLSYYTSFHISHLSNIEAGRAKLSSAILKAYEEYLEFKPHQIGAFFLLLRAEIIPVDSLLTDVSQAELYNAVKIVEVLDCFPELLEPVAVFIKSAGCGLSGYLKTYHSEIVNELERHHRPSLVEFRLRTLLKNQSERDS